MIMGEIKLFETSKERKSLEDLADLYSIIRATESLETAYSRDAITPSEYAESCKRLISQFKTTEVALVSSKAIISAENFIREYQVDCPRAYERLIISGVPATVLHASSDNRAESVVVAETVQAFITAMDSLRLQQKAVDEVQPLIADIMSSLGKAPNLPADFEGLLKMRLWLKKLNEMRAMDEIDEDDSRQLLFDLDTSYSAFHKHLAGKSDSGFTKN
mmetsp:Transcript_10255/g.15381  ORF Transcript_10255/g.15381 Transcript_10255/m.15381 type:complete len:218 (+) Transcript_10255:3-656(+)